MSASKNYDKAEAELKAFTRSSVRTKIMLTLMENENDSGSLAKEVGLRASTILHTMKELIDDNLVVKTDQGYALTNIGRVQAMMLDKLVSTIIALKQNEEFWRTHDLSGIPDELQMKIWMLADSRIVTADSIALLKSIENFIAELIKSKEVYGISPVIGPGYSEAINSAIANGAKVSLILTGNLLERVIMEYASMLKDLLQCERFKLYRIDDDVKVAFTVTDSLLSLGLFRLDGEYDIGNDLICEGESARTWGKELFEYYLSKSKIVNFV